jgi:transcriptional regulator with XRE-family HTH domain
MPAYDINSYDRSREEDIKADARVRAFFALRKAWKDRSSAHGVRAQDLADVLGKDKGYVSRVLAGKTRTITLETLAVFLEALGYYLPMHPTRAEDLSRANRDVRPSESILADQNTVTKDVPSNRVLATNVHVPEMRILPGP